MEDSTPEGYVNDDYYRVATKEAHIGIFCYLNGEKMGFSSINPAILKMFGYKSLDEFNEDFEKNICLSPSQWKKFIGEVVKKGEVLDREVLFKSKNGELVWALCSAKMNKDSRKMGKVLLGSMVDISEYKKKENEREKLQTKIVQSEKMAGVGILAGGIAHEFNNLLQVMGVYVELAKRTKEPEDVDEALDAVLESSQEAKRLIESLMSFSKKNSERRNMCQIADEVDSVISIVGSQLRKYGIQVVKKYTEVPEIRVNKAELNLVFLDMIVNARDAMIPNGGTLEVSIKQADYFIEICFKDTGKGIEKENLCKVFEPFFTTKGALGGGDEFGKGLGLFVSYGAVKRHGGEIEVESEVGKGTKFTIRLPVVKRKHAEKKIVHDNGEQEEGKKTLNILVIDDEERLCKLLTRYFRHLGHKVTSVSHTEQLDSLLNKDNYDIVFLDIVMPGATGIEVLKQIKKTSSQSKVIMMTGKLKDEELMSELNAAGASK